VKRFAGVLIGTALLCPLIAHAQAREPPIQTAPALTTRPDRPRDFAGRYEHTDPGSGHTWTLVLDAEGGGTALLNGQPARDSAGLFVTFRYRVVGSDLYVSGADNSEESLFGSFNGTALTTVLGWRYDKR
jgi:hypothetical protein